MNTKKDEKRLAALSRSLEEEAKSVENKSSLAVSSNRFNKAEEFFNEENVSVSLPPSPQPEKKSLVRDSFTFPVEDHDLIQKIIHRCLRQGVNVNKSETLRAALRLLDQLSDSELLEAFQGIEKIKAGRPGKKNYK